MPNHIAYTLVAHTVYLALYLHVWRLGSSCQPVTQDYVTVRDQAAEGEMMGEHEYRHLGYTADLIIVFCATVSALVH